MPRLSLRNRLLYASASLGGNALSRTRDLWFLYFYAPPDDADIPRRAGTLAIGFVLFAIRFLDALDDPLAGYWSDRSHSRLGRRIPFVLAATPFVAILFVLLWVPPTADESGANLLYVFFTLWLLSYATTLSGGVFEALLPEIAPRAEDRLSIVTFQVLFGVVGAVLGLVVSGLLIDTVGYRGMAAVLAVVALVTRYLGVAGAWSAAIADARRGKPRPDPAAFRAEVRACLRNEQFVAFLPTFILYSTGVAIMIGAMPFLVSGVLGHEDEGLMVAAINGVAIGSVVVVLPFTVRLAARNSKRTMYSWGMFLGGLYFPLLFFVGFVPGINGDAQALLFAAPLGLALAPLQTFPNALLADIADYDRERTGVRREAMYYSTQNLFEKVAGSFAPAILAILLVLGSTEDDPLGIRLIGPVAGVLTFVGYLAFRPYCLPDQVTPETAADIAAKRSLTPFRTGRFRTKG